MRREATIGPARVEKKKKEKTTGDDAVNRVVKFSGVTGSASGSASEAWSWKT